MNPVAAHIDASNGVVIAAKVSLWFISFFTDPVVENELARGIEGVSKFSELGPLQWGNSRPPRPGNLKKTTKVCYDIEHEVACQKHMEGKQPGSFGKLDIPYFGASLNNLNVVRLWYAMIDTTESGTKYSDAFLQSRIEWLTRGGLNMHVLLQNVYKPFWMANRPRSVIKIQQGTSARSLGYDTISANAKRTDSYCSDKTIVFGRMTCTQVADFTQVRRPRPLLLSAPSPQKL
jgi:hypothetical protein